MFEVLFLTIMVNNHTNHFLVIVEGRTERLVRMYIQGQVAQMYINRDERLTTLTV